MSIKEMFGRLFSIKPFRLLAIYSLIIGLLVPVGGSVMILAFHFWSKSWLPIILFLVVLPAMVLPLLILLSRRYLRDIDRMVAGEAWAHWRYDEQEWQSFNRVESRRNRRSAFSSYLVMIVGAVAFLVGGLVFPDGSDARNTLIGIGIFLIGIGAAMMLLIVGLRGSGRAGLNNEGEVYITPLGVYQVPGGYTPLFGVGQSLRQVELKPGEPTILSFDCTFRRDSTSAGYNTNVAALVIPAGYEDEAKSLVERFYREIFKISV